MLIIRFTFDNDGSAFSQMLYVSGCISYVGYGMVTFNTSTSVKDAIPFTKTQADEFIWNRKVVESLWIVEALPADDSR